MFRVPARYDARVTTTTTTAQTGILGTTVVLARDIKLAHSVFALPFALLGLFMAAWPANPDFRIPGSDLLIDVVLVVLAMVLLARLPCWPIAGWIGISMPGIQEPPSVRSRLARQLPRR